MTNRNLIIVTLFSFFLSNDIFSQITISEVKTETNQIVQKPEPLDNSQDFLFSNKMSDYRKYIGMELYLPPIESFDKKSRDRSQIDKSFLFTTKPNTIILDSNNHANGVELIEYNRYKTGENKVEREFKNIVTYFYLPKIVDKEKGSYWSNSQYNTTPIKSIYASNSNDIGNNYFTILDVLYSDEKDSVLMHMSEVMYGLSKVNGASAIESSFNRERIRLIYLLRNNKTKDSVYFINENSELGNFFINVPYFTYLKSNTENKTFVYDDKKASYGDYLNKPLTAFDMRVIEEYETNNGTKKKRYKPIKVDFGSKWQCIEVTLLKPEYKITYILKNQIGDQIYFYSIPGFIEENEYKKRNQDELLAQNQLLEKRKKEEAERTLRVNREKAEHKNTCIAKFGQENGTLIADGKVKIGMSKEMCEYAWGIPYWSDKTTTSNLINEHWYYSLGYSLHFRDGILTMIKER